MKPLSANERDVRAAFVKLANAFNTFAEFIRHDGLVERFQSRELITMVKNLHSKLQGAFIGADQGNFNVVDRNLPYQSIVDIGLTAGQFMTLCLKELNTSKLELPNLQNSYLKESLITGAREFIVIESKGKEQLLKDHSVTVLKAEKIGDEAPNLLHQAWGASIRKAASDFKEIMPALDEGAKLDREAMLRGLRAQISPTEHTKP